MQTIPPTTDAPVPPRRVTDRSRILSSAHLDQEPAAALRKTAPVREIIYHALLVACAATIILLSSLLHVSTDGRVVSPFLGNASLPGMCVSHEYLGIPCPGCGMTRCFVSIANSQWRQAWQFNAGGVLLFAVVLVQIPFGVWQMVRILAGKPALRLGHASWLVYVLLAVIFVQWGAKLVERFV